jgi:hypothetical protein
MGSGRSRVAMDIAELSAVGELLRFGYWRSAFVACLSHCKQDTRCERALARASAVCADAGSPLGQALWLGLQGAVASVQHQRAGELG